MKTLKAITPLLTRVIAFLCFFVIISGIAGPRIISGGILFRDGFAMYGGIGKAMIFAFIAFALLARHNKTQVTLLPWHPTSLGWFLASLVSFAVAWQATNNLLLGQRELQHLVMAHAGLLLCLAFVAVGCFGLKNIQLLWRAYRREIMVSGGLAAVFYAFLTVVYALWQPLASVVLVSVKGLLDMTGLHAVIVPPHTLVFDKFGITIAEFCSGIESIALFTSLYAIVGLLDWKRLNKKRYFTLFPIALVGLFLLNIVRVFGLIMAGYYINPDIAFSLFHTYAGMVFFILYSAAFWAVAYKFIINKKEPAPAEAPPS